MEIAMSPSTLDIVICTYNRADVLQKNLERLLPLVEKEPGVTVLVVDNNSPDNTADVVRTVQERFPRLLRYVHEPDQGVANARTRGFREATAEWVGYLDDDTHPHENWISRALEVIRSGDFDAFGGGYLPWHYYPGKPDWFPEGTSSLNMEGKRYGPMPVDESPWGGNLFCRRDLMERTGGFDPAAGMRGDKPGYGEENLFCDALRALGVRIGQVPDLLVDHCVMPVKYTMRWHFASNFAKGKISWKLTGKRPTAGKTAALMLSLPFIVLRDAVRGVVRLGREEKLTPQAWAFFVGSRAAMRLGRIAGCFAKD